MALMLTLNKEKNGRDRPASTEGYLPRRAQMKLKNQIYSSPRQEKEFSARVMYTVACRASDGAHPAKKNGGSEGDFGKRSFAEVSAKWAFRLQRKGCAERAVAPQMRNCALQRETLNLIPCGAKSSEMGAETAKFITAVRRNLYATWGYRETTTWGG